MAAPLLEVRNLHAGYGPTEVLHGLDFAIEEGSITALLGANGAGKTTTLRALCGMVRTSGARPKEGSSSSSRRGRSIRARATASICCWPPDKVPACWCRRSARMGNSWYMRS